MKLHDGSIQYNEQLKCYGMMGLDGSWVKESLEDGDRIRILLGNEVFETKFCSGPYFPTLVPLPMDNWEYLTGKPAAYYEFEELNKKPVKSEAEKKRFRKLMAFGSIAICLAINALLAVSFAAISSASGDSFSDVFHSAFSICFTLFGGASVVMAFLLLATNLPDDFAYKYGVALYYGFFVCALILTRILGLEENESTFILSGIFSVLFCYIHWLKKKDTNS